MNRMTLRHIMAVGLLAMGVGHSFGNPSGGQVGAGSASINTLPGTVTINQLSNIAIINWQTFSIGAGELTKFVQPASVSATLNRVLGGQTSVINGTLSANGRVYLINGNGIVIGPGGVVCANSFIASTRNITDSDFLSGDLLFTGRSDAGVENLGKIKALGGDVYLIGKTIKNRRSIQAPDGTAGLASGDDVLLNLCGEEHVFVCPSCTASGDRHRIAIDNRGTIAAASVELKVANGNLFALAINNEGTIRATAVEHHGGHIFLTDGGGFIRNTGHLIEKSGEHVTIVDSHRGGDGYHSRDGDSVFDFSANGWENRDFNFDFSRDGGEDGGRIFDFRREHRLDHRWDHRWERDHCSPPPVTPPKTNYLVQQNVISFAVSGFNHLSTGLQFYICAPGALSPDSISVDSLTGGVLNDGDGNNIASGSSTSGDPGPQRLVTPGNGIWNIFAGTVHSTPPPIFVIQQLQFNLSPAVFAHLQEILFGNP